MQGRIQGGGVRTRRAPPPKIGKNMIFLRKIVIFHTKYPQNFRASLRSARFFLSAQPNLKSWIRPWLWPKSVSLVQSGPHHHLCEFKSCSWRDLLDTTLCDKVCQELAAGWWFSPVLSAKKKLNAVI